MPILPKPYPDETVGSVMARACVHTGLPMRRLLQSIFEKNRSTFSFLLGTEICQLALRAGVEPRRFLFEHTVFPYSVAFMAPKIQEHLVAKALAPRAGEDCLGSLTKNVSHGVTHLRVCRACIAEDVQQYGESYWHRQHLLPGVLVCLRHGEPLFETSIPL